MSLFPRIWQSIVSSFSSRFVFRPHFLHVFCFVCLRPNVWSILWNVSGAHFLREISNRSKSFVANSDASFCCHTSNSSFRKAQASTRARGSKHWPRNPSSKWMNVRCTSSSRCRDMASSSVSLRQSSTPDVECFASEDSISAGSGMTSNTPVSLPGRPSDNTNSSGKFGGNRVTSLWFMCWRPAEAAISMGQYITVCISVLSSYDSTIASNEDPESHCKEIFFPTRSVPLAATLLPTDRSLPGRFAAHIVLRNSGIMNNCWSTEFI